MTMNVLYHSSDSYMYMPFVSSGIVRANFKECIRDCYFELIFNKPTSFHYGQEPSRLDLILTNDALINKTLLTRALSRQSDHILVKFDYVWYTQYINTSVINFNYKKADFKKLREGMLLERDILMKFKNKDTNKMIDLIMTEIHIKKIKHIPKKEEQCEKKQNVTEWGNKNTNYINRSWERYIKHNNEENDKIKYTRIRNRAKAIAKERQNHENVIAETVKSNC